MNRQELLQKRYFRKGEKSWEDVVKRVVKHSGLIGKTRDNVYDLIYNYKFLPSRMPYMGTDKPFSSSCFVLPIDDSIDSIMETLANAVKLQKFGGGCIGGESIIATNIGPIKLKDLVELRDESIKVLSYNEKTGEMGYKRVLAWHETKLKANRIVNVKFKNTGAIRASDWHPFYIFNGEFIENVRADELKGGMLVIGSSFGGDFNLYSLNKEAWLYGYIVGNGAIEKKSSKRLARVRVVSAYKDTIEFFAEVLGIKSSLLKDKRHKIPVWGSNLTRKKLAGEIRNQFICDVDVYTKHVPFYLWEASQEEMFSFLVGYLDADGSFNKKRNTFEVSTVSKILANDLICLLGILGIRAKIRRKKSRRNNEKDIYEITIKNSESVSKNIIRLSKKYNNSINTNNTNAREGVYEIIKFCNNNVNMASSIRAGHIIENVSFSEFDDTLYDLTVEDNQTYLASPAGKPAFVVVHNTGFNFSHLRPKNSRISSTDGMASGPVSFMTLYDKAMNVVKRAGKKHSAQMAVLNVDHPDIFEFIKCKREEGELSTFNISVAVSDDFMTAVDLDRNWDLKWGRGVYKKVRAREIWDSLIEGAYNNGEPGIIFLDRVNRKSKYPEKIEASNPCAEQFLPPNVSCNLGSVNLSKFVNDKHVLWTELGKAVEYGIYFLDASLQNAWFPLDFIAEKTKNYRNVGLGVMGWHDMLIKLDIAYDSEEAVDLAEKLSLFISDKARGASLNIGRDLGLDKQANKTLTSIAPTGSISFLADCSSGIEPLFGVVYTHTSQIGNIYRVNKEFEKRSKELGFYSEELLSEISRTGSVQGLDNVPPRIQELFKIGTEIDATFHVAHQAAWQKHFDNGVSKTVNLPNTATKKDVEDIFLLANSLECLSITVYREGSRKNQVITVGNEKKKIKPIRREKVERPAILEGKTVKVNTPNGKIYVTVNSLEGNLNKPLEVFVNVGKAGTAITALAEAMGRLMSLILRLNSDESGRYRILQIIDEIEGIGTNQSIGYGEQKVLSLPDGIAKALNIILKQKKIVNHLNHIQDGDMNNKGYDICPTCGNFSLVRDSGCKSCVVCGYSEC